MIKHIYISENNVDMFNTEINPEQTVETVELPPLPEAVSKPASELSFFAGKAFISFGVLLICIIVILIAAYIIKNRIPAKDASAHEIFSDDGYEDVSENKSVPFPDTTAKKSNISTFGSIHKCIVTFLEKTKDI